MECINKKSCPCTKTSCPNHGRCCACVNKHIATDSLPFCVFPDNDGDKSLKNFYLKLDKKFGKPKPKPMPKAASKPASKTASKTASKPRSKRPKGGSGDGLPRINLRL